ncbi:unnamed protein product [Nesidiocoris tenuis]|uniref:Glycolipid transfer protein domain-containing protein n=1 Tax=Nesidiocoris tenuis TaxID=355587 RepID=A0A6H5H8M2_9HEMI|nr:unnamed protein product [Nesidiocoris tenuis]
MVNDVEPRSSFFDLPLIYKHLQNCLLEGDDVSIDLYLEAYKELIKFCELLGGIFGYVKDEIESKSKILNELRSSRPEMFQTVKTMIQYEKESRLLKKDGYVSGCRTLLRLHWGFDFIRNFLDRVRNLELDQYTSTVGHEVYNATLSHHHAWYVRIGARYAIGSLPLKQVMYEKVNFTHVDGEAIYTNKPTKKYGSLVRESNEGHRSDDEKIVVTEFTLSITVVPIRSVEEIRRYYELFVLVPFSLVCMRFN